MITKTLSLRILRPLYSDDVEKEILEEKERNKKNHISCHNNFWSDLEQKHPEIVTWKELSELFIQLQKQSSEAYNKAISKLYKAKLIDKEKGSTEKFLSKIAYPEFYKVFKNSYIAMGLRQKVKSNFREKELRQMKIALPTARADSFPIAFWIAQGVKIEQYNNDFVICMKFPYFKKKSEIDKCRPWEKFDFMPKKTREIKLILSTKKRQKNKGWALDNGTDAEIRRVLTGEYEKNWSEWIVNHPVEYMKNKTKYDNAHKVSWLELVKRKKIGFGRSSWFVNFVIKVPQREGLGLDENLIGGVNIGVKSPMVCAIRDSLKRYAINANDIYTHNRRMSSRRRAIGKKNYLKRKGHGKNNKLKPITVLTEKSNAFRKKIIERWAVEVARFFVKNKVGVVQMEDLTSMKNREDDYFNAVLRISWPYYQMQSQLENKFKEYGVEVVYVKPAYTSQICSGCGAWNRDFTFKNRMEKKFPDFECVACGFKANADYNAALNIANPGIEKISRKIEKIVKRERVK